MLFNFSQFNQKMPHTLPQTGRGARELTETEVLDLAEQHVVYLEEQTDDGELMQMLFGMADDVPTMATIHLHTWQNCDDDDLPGMSSGAGFPRRISSTQALLQRAQGAQGSSSVPAGGAAGVQRGPSPRPAMNAQPQAMQHSQQQQHHVLQPPASMGKQQQQQRGMTSPPQQQQQQQHQMQGYPQQQSYDPGPHGYGRPQMQGGYMQPNTGQLGYPGYDVNGQAQQGTNHPYMPMQGGVFTPSSYSMPGGMFSAAAVLAASQQQQQQQGTGGGGGGEGGQGAGHSQNGPSAGPGGVKQGVQPSNQQSPSQQQQLQPQQQGNTNQHETHQQQQQAQQHMQQHMSGKAMFADPDLPATCGEER
jgi:hypothetical protein